MSRASLSLALLAAILLVLPAFARGYALSIATLILYFAYTGQAWNVMMGFAGQLSLGHSLYVGVAGYAAAGLFFHYGVGPWAGLWLAIVQRPSARVTFLALQTSWLWRRTSKSHC